MPILHSEMALPLRAP